MAVQELFAYLCVPNAAAAIHFYTKAFDAREKFRLTEPGGRIGHAELDFGGTILMLSDEYPECGIRGPQPGTGTPVAPVAWEELEHVRLVRDFLNRPDAFLRHL